MNFRLLAALMTTTMFSTVIGFSAPPAPSGGEALAAAGDASGVANLRLPPVGEQRALDLVDASEPEGLLPDQTSSIKLYWKLLSFSCACGGKVHLYVDGKYKGYATGAGTYTVRRLKLEGGRKYTFYAIDECGTTAWGPSRYRMKSSWSTFTWTLTCTGGGITPTSGSWTGTTSRGQPMSYQVISGGTQYRYFKLKTDFDFGSCYGTTETTVTSTGSISNGSFGSTGGTFGYTGQFSSATSATGTYQYSGLYIYPCGYLYQTGTWSANWASSALADGAEREAGEPEQPGRSNKVTIEHIDATARER
ncbi:MAG: hypothetical protein HYX75_09840 [Acidobacteria bacterium]|nr:hypothetical protein [Acidobacteriota bacterium]